MVVRWCGKSRKDFSTVFLLSHMSFRGRRSFECTHKIPELYTPLAIQRVGGAQHAQSVPVTLYADSSQDWVKADGLPADKSLMRFDTSVIYIWICRLANL
jgi:hypothetical protein